jgi:hypothetical protein
MSDSYIGIDQKILYHKLKKVEKTYPDGHPERIKIREQEAEILAKYPELETEK